MLLSDAAADDYGEDESYYCRLTSHSKKKNQRTQRGPPLLSENLFFKTAELDYYKYLFRLQQQAEGGLISR